MSKPLIRRTTTMTEAFLTAAREGGLATEGVRLPVKTEPAWTSTPRKKPRRK